MTTRALGRVNANAIDDDDARTSFWAFAMGEVKRWFKAQPGNLAVAAPLLAWPRRGLFAYDTLRGIATNALAVMIGMCALTMFLGWTDVALSEGHAWARVWLRARGA